MIWLLTIVNSTYLIYKADFFYEGVNNMSGQRKTDKYRLIEGRGYGENENYSPWYKIHEFGSRSRRHRIIGWKQKRIHQLMSDLELYYFLIMQWNDNVIDIKEQYPLLPIEETLLIADEYEIIHPPISSKNVKDKTVMTTDFLLTVNTGKDIKQIARTIKPVYELSKRRIIEKFKIEQEYWRRRGTDWGIITNEQIPVIRAQNIYYIYQDYFWADENGYDTTYVHSMINDFKNILSNNDFDALRTIREFENKNGWQEGAGLSFFKFLLARKIVKTDFDTKFDFHKIKIWMD